MRIIVSDSQTDTYLYLMGIILERPLHIAPHLILEPASCNPLPDDMIDSIMKHGSKSETELGILISSLRKTSAQLKISSKNPEELVKLAWNAQTAAVLLSALLNCEIYWQIQGNTPANCFSSESNINVFLSTRLFIPRGVHCVNEEECIWLEENYSDAWALLDNDQFAIAANALWSYRQNLRPSTQLAIIWSGIEALFNVQHELVFRISTLAALFLGEGKGKQMEIKKLYSSRSKAVHEGKQPNGSDVDVSAKLLHELIKRCVELKSLPDEDELLFD